VVVKKNDKQCTGDLNFSPGGGQSRGDFTQGREASTGCMLSNFASKKKNAKIRFRRWAVSKAGAGRQGESGSGQSSRKFIWLAGWTGVVGGFRAFWLRGNQSQKIGG